MARTAASPNSRRLRWALLIALALHGLLLWRYAPNLFARFEAARQSEANPAEPPPSEQIVDITPLPPPPKGRGMVMSSKLGAEGLQTQLPAGFFDKPPPLALGTMHLADDLDFSRVSGLQIVANIVPAAVRLPKIKAISEAPRTPKPRPATEIAPRPAVAARSAEERPPPEAPIDEPVDIAPPIPFLPPPPVEESYDVDAAIAAAANAAEQSVRVARSQAAAVKSAPDLRSMLPQGPMVAAPPLPLASGSAAPRPVAPSADSGITTFAMDAPAARDATRAAPDQGKAVAVARQRFFSQLTARLKATNVRMLAEAVKAGPRTTVRVSFLVDRDGRVLQVSPAEPATRELLERAAQVVRAANLPPVPDEMTQVPLELSFPIEVYR